MEKKNKGAEIERKSSLLHMLKEMEQRGITQEDPVRQRMFANVLDQQARSSGIPQYGIFELTPRCNFDCKMCYVHLEKEQMKNAEELPGNIWKSLMDEAIEHGMMKAQLTGGEAMLHPDFEDIYLHLYEKGIWISVLSNGFLLNRDRVEFFKTYPPATLQVSLYGSNNESYERLTGRAVYDTVKEHILLSRDIPTRFSLAATPSRYFPAGEVKQALEFAKEAGIRISVNGDLSEPYEETERSLKDVEVDEDEYVRMRRTLCEFHGVEIHPYTGELPKPAQKTEPGQGVLCAAGRALFAVNWRGEMRACLDLPFKAYPLKDGFQKSWEYVHRMAVNYPIPGECLSCAYHKICVRCPVVHGKGAEPGHADRRICRRTVRMVQEGLVNVSALEKS